MTTPVQYIGTSRPFFELAITGKQQSWQPGQLCDRSDADAALLIASGQFKLALSQVDDNADQTDGSVLRPSLQALVSGYGFVFPAGIVADGITSDSAAINAAILANPGTLTRQRVVKPPPGFSYAIDAPIIQADYTTLDISGCTLIVSGATGKTIITNSARVGAPVRQTTDAVLVAGTKSVQSATAAFTTADIGRSVWTATGSSSSVNTHFTAKITGITDAQNAQLEFAPGASVSGATMKIFNRNKRVKLVGDGATRIVRTLASATNDTDQHAVVYTRIDDLEISGIEYYSTVAKYGFNLNDVRQWYVHGMKFACYSDGLHVTGPSENGLAERFEGATGDDYIAFGCMDYATYCETQGPLYDLSVKRMHSTGGKGFHLFAGANDAAHYAKAITIEHVTGDYTACPVNVEAGSGDSLSTVDGIVVRRVKPNSTANYAHVLVGSTTGQNMGVVHIDDVLDDGASGAGTVPNIQVKANLRALHVSELNRTTKSAASAAVSVFAGSTIGQIKFSGLVGKFGAANADIISIDPAATVSVLDYDNADIDGHSGVKLINGNAGTLNANNMSARNMGGGYQFWLTGTCDLNLANVDLGPSYMAVRSGGGLVTVRGAGIKWSPTIAMQGAGSGTIDPRSFELYGEADRPGINKSDGNHMRNTKAALSCGAGLIVANGTAFKNLYTGATY